MSGIFLVKEPSARPITAEAFKDFEYVEAAFGRRAVYLFAHLQHRGHDAGPSFCAAFRGHILGHMGTLRFAARMLERTDGYQRILRAVMQDYSLAEIKAVWARRMSEEAGIAEPPAEAQPSRPRTVILSRPQPVAVPSALTPLQCDVADILPLLESIVDFPPTNARQTRGRRAPSRLCPFFPPMPPPAIRCSVH
jgi:hypothetical protein